VTRSDNRNTKLQVWLSKEDFEKLQQFLDKFSAGDLLSD
jgi:type II secretory pathway component PulM